MTPSSKFSNCPHTLWVPISWLTMDYNIPSFPSSVINTSMDTELWVPSSQSTMDYNIPWIPSSEFLIGPCTDKNQCIGTEFLFGPRTDKNQFMNTKFQVGYWQKSTYDIEFRVHYIKINRLSDVNLMDFNILILCINILNLFYHRLSLDLWIVLDQWFSFKWTFNIHILWWIL